MIIAPEGSLHAARVIDAGHECPPSASLTGRRVKPILLPVDWLTVTALAVLSSLMAIALVRSVITRRRRALWLLLIPLALFTVRWAVYRSRWSELGLSALLAAVAVSLWWFAYGRRLPPPTDDNIRVWTKDDPF